MSEAASTGLASTLAAVAFGGLVTYVLMGGFKDKEAPAAEAAARAAAAADAAAAELLADAPPSGEPAGEPAGKKKKKKKKKKAPAAAPPAAAAAPTAGEGTDADSDATPKATKKKKKKKKPKGGAAAPAAGSERESNGASGAAAAAAPVPPPPQKAIAPRQPIVFAEEEEWVSVKTAPKRNKPLNGQRKKPAAASGPTSEAVVIDAKKVGIIIGPKGATMKAIEEATGCHVEVNAPDKGAPVGSGPQKATVLLSGGDAAQTAKARAAVRELATKGFATLLQTDASFGESYVEVHPRHLSEIVGKGGKVIQAIQKGCNVTLTIPPTDWRPDAPAAIVKGAPPSCRVGIAGSAADAARAREVVRALAQHHHHDLTHPGQVHKGVWVPWERRGIVVGPRGGEMKHIRGNYGVEVYLPHGDDGGDDEEVLVVGPPAAVDRAIAHIEKLLARESARQESRYSDEAY